MAIIELKGVTKSYNKKILDNFNMSINENEFVAIVGESGKGKSTLLNIVGLLENVDSGEIIIDGESNIEPNSSKASKILRYKINYLFQNFALIDEETVMKNLMLALKYVSINKVDKVNRIKEALDKVGLSGYKDKKVFELSGGEQQRVAIARCILKQSKIILADEPTGSLDEKNRDKVICLLKDMNKEGKTILVVTHDKKVAEEGGRIIDL